MLVIIFQRIKYFSLRFYWTLYLYRKVDGRIKLQGYLDKLKVSSSFRCAGDLWLGIYDKNGSIFLGSHVTASGPLIITSINKIVIGSDVLFGPNVLITDHYHGDSKSIDFLSKTPSKRKLFSPGPIIICNQVHIGANVVILSPSKIGEKVVIGANSVVKSNLKENTIHAGNPIRIIERY